MPCPVPRPPITLTSPPHHSPPLLWPAHTWPAGVTTYLLGVSLRGGILAMTAAGAPLPDGRRQFSFGPDRYKARGCGALG